MVVLPTCLLATYATFCYIGKRKIIQSANISDVSINIFLPRFAFRMTCKHVMLAIVLENMITYCKHSIIILLFLIPYITDRKRESPMFSVNLVCKHPFTIVFMAYQSES